MGPETISILLVALAASAHLLCRPIAGATGFFRFGLAAIPLGFSLCMPWLASWTSPSARIEWLRAPVTSISLWSYAIYLCHHMIFLGMSAWIGGDAAPASLKLLGKVLALGMILLVSFLVHRAYESPLTRRRPPELRDRGEPATAPVPVD